MSDIKLFRIAGNAVSQLDGQSVQLEKSLQNLMEQNLDALLGVSFLKTEHPTGKTHGGRIDTLGIDENGCPVIIEYKRTTNENVINQGLFYLDWLLDHKAEFELLVLKKLGAEKSEAIDWSGSRVLCIAGDFTKYDLHAVSQINRNIELIRYKKFGEELLMLDLINRVVSSSDGSGQPASTVSGSGGRAKTVTEYFASAEPELVDRYEAVRDFLLNLGDDVEEKTLKNYVAFRRLKNFACVEPRVNAAELLIYVKVDPDTVDLLDSFTRDVRSIGHYGTGDLEIKLKTADDLERAKPILIKSYEAS
jgi:predicted transport protein